jgi:hypothetical protein
MPITAPRTPPSVEYRLAVGTEAKFADNEVRPDRSPPSEAW